MTSTSGCQIQRSGSSGCYSYSVASDWANRPVNYVSYWDSCRFTNWLNNGQGNGDTENGTYTLDNYNGDDGRTIQRNAGAIWAVTSEDEWYKAAYYRGGGTNAGYWDYPTQSDSAPGRNLSGTNDANYWVDGFLDPNHYRTEVGAFSNCKGAYGTFDQGGNLYEWNEAIIYQGSTYTCRGLRGGSFDGGNGGPGDCGLNAAYRQGHSAATYEDDNFGFRVAAMDPVPEPSSFIALAGGFAGLLGTRRRKASVSH
jgi:formylglycine-generating enzyme